MGRFQVNIVDSVRDTRSYSIPTVSESTSSTTPYADVALAFTEYRTALSNVLACEISRLDYSTTSEEPSTDPDLLPNSAQVQIEALIEFTVAGMDGPRYISRVPGFDINNADLVRQNGQLVLPLASTTGVALVNAFENLYLFPGPYDNPTAPGAGSATVTRIFVVQS